MVRASVKAVTKAGLGENVRKGIEASEIESSKGWFVVVTKVVKEYRRGR